MISRKQKEPLRNLLFIVDVDILDTAKAKI